MAQGYTAPEKTPADVKADKAEAKSVKHADLSAAGSSGDPYVQQLLAERQTAQLNRESLQSTDEAAIKALHDDVKAADERIAELDKQLADLGYC